MSFLFNYCLTSEINDIWLKHSLLEWFPKSAMRMELIFSVWFGLFCSVFGMFCLDYICYGDSSYKQKYSFAHVKNTAINFRLLAAVIWHFLGYKCQGYVIWHREKCLWLNDIYGNCVKICWNAKEFPLSGPLKVRLYPEPAEETTFFFHHSVDNLFLCPPPFYSMWKYSTFWPVRFFS